MCVAWGETGLVNANTEALLLPLVSRDAQGNRPQSAEASLPTEQFMAETENFFDAHPERIPLSRYGDLSTRSHNALAGPSQTRMMKSMSVDAINLKVRSQLLPQIKQPGMSVTWAGSAGGFGAGDSKKNTGNGWNRSMRSDEWSRPAVRATGSRHGASQRNRTGKSLTWLAADSPKPDVAYEHLLEDEEASYGAGPPSLWPLGHEAEYVCRLGDLVLCSRLREAYEVGFRGKKRDKPSATELLLGGTGDALRVRRTAKVETISCDICGFHLADADKPGGCFFYYCKRCKRSGRRFELCMACHGLEILQGEGKYSGRGLHPHFLRCQHRTLIRRQNLENAYPSSPHLHRVFCDLCGHTVVGRGANDAATRAMSAVGASGDGSSKYLSLPNEFYICPRCPDERGLRFELCEHCATTLMERGRGIHRLQGLETCM
ncbi:unnamed protein product [Polarella glacialis]|uniref:Uncharacterized protein n=1 Tax=Polarella glacialis TaxID=89957 RepID=A0A813GFD3_POLGL|nr:unnamed protein product [Polarella glacialis]